MIGYAVGENDAIPLGQAYTGSKSVITVGDFDVRIKGAPQKIGDGLREMMLTALFESNYFVVIDRMDTEGITAEMLLSESFLSNPDAILNQGQMHPAELLIYGAIIALEGGGSGLRIKIPWLPFKVGGKNHLAKATIQLRIVEAATGRLVATHSVEGFARSGSGMAGASVSGYDIPVSLKVVKNTPLELAIRDCINRAVMELCTTIPRSFFHVKD